MEAHLLDRDYIKELLAEEEAANKAHPDRKNFIPYDEAPERLKKLVLKE